MSGHRVDNIINTVNQLRQRIACNRAASRSFSDFVLQMLTPCEEDVVLDIGSGLGSQLLPVSERVRRVVGLDVSADMVNELRQHIPQSKGVVVHGNMDELDSIELGGPFSLVYAVYSLYYSRDPAAVVRRVAEYLCGEQARFVAINPDVGNNEGWFADLGHLYELPADFVGVPQITRRDILPAFLDTFRKTSCFAYENRVRFATLEGLMAYYDACAPYCRPDKRREAQDHFGAKMEREGSYEITKRSLALVGSSRKGREA